VPQLCLLDRLRDVGNARNIIEDNHGIVVKWHITRHQIRFSGLNLCHLR